MSEKRDLRKDLEGLQVIKSEWAELPRGIVGEYLNRAIEAEDFIEKLKLGVLYDELAQLRKTARDCANCEFKASNHYRGKIATLTEENKILKNAVLNNSNVIVNTPPFPETDVIRIYQEHILGLQKEIHRLRYPELHSGTAMQLMAHAQEVADTQANNLAFLTEENDIQRQAIQNLSAQVAHYKNEGECVNAHNDHGDYYHRDVPASYTDKLEKKNVKLTAQVVGYRNGLEKIVPMETRCGFITKSGKIAQELLDSPDPGAEIRERVAKLEKVAEYADALLKAIVAERDDGENIPEIQPWEGMLCEALKGVNQHGPEENERPETAD